MKIFSIASAILLSLCPALALANTGPLVTTASGPISGKREGAVVVFQGIPFAQPPVGELRWRPPLPAKRWTAVLRADAFGPACPQIAKTPTQMSPLPGLSEDCLTLNVWAPAHTKRRTPIMVWIHGGGFFTGSGAERQFDGSALARRGVMVVTLNYRLGRLGFFMHPALRKEAGGQASGNFGLLDQIAAIRFIRQNAAAFGGDPRNITVFGESAGGMSVAALMTSPLARGLFAKAIIQSGAIPRSWRSLDEASAQGAEWARQMGVDGDDAAALKALRALPADRIAPPVPALADILALQASTMPIQDRLVIREDLTVAFKRGHQQHIPLIIGSNGNEAHLWNFGEHPEPIPLLPFDLSAFSRSRADGPRIVAGYVDATHGDRQAASDRLASDLFLGASTLRLAKLHARVAPTWLYRFDAVPSPGRGAATSAPHGTDIWYVFGTLESIPQWSNGIETSDRNASRAIGDMWAKFATSGTPNGRGTWPRLNQGGLILMVSNNHVAAARVPMERCQHLLSNGNP